MGTVTNDVLSAEAQQTAGQGKQFTPDRIAALLDGWRPQVLREMGRRRLWRGADAAELEDQFQDVALVLCGRDFASEEHLRRALWTGLGFRAKDFWKAARRREIPVGEFFEETLGDDRLQAVEDAAATAADRRYVDDCLSELDPRERSVYKLAKGEQLSRRRVAKTLRLSEAEVLRVLYRAQRKIDQVAVLVAAGRLCGRRRSAVASLARGQARGLTLEQARAHLSHCPDCLLAFREQRAALSREVASVLPLPTLAHDQGASVAAALDHLRGLPGAVKRQAYELAGRTPSGGAEEAVAGAGGLAIGTKVVVTLCVGAAAGGGAICANQLGVLPDEDRPQSASKPATERAEARTRPVEATQASAVPAPAEAQQANEDASKAPPPPTPPPDPSPPPVRKDPPQEFFGGGGGSPSGGSNEVQPSAASPPSGANSSGSGGGSSQGGGSGGEFFGE
jgi:RNA polymerase sigma factor (sigma-70 family)